MFPSRRRSVIYFLYDCPVFQRISPGYDLDRNVNIINDTQHKPSLDPFPAGGLIRAGGESQEGFRVWTNVKQV